MFSLQFTASRMKSLSFQKQSILLLLMEGTLSKTIRMLCIENEAFCSEDCIERLMGTFRDWLSQAYMERRTKVSVFE